MTSRYVDDGQAPGAGPDGPDWMKQVSDAIGILFDSIAIRPTNVTNTGNQYTFTIDPVLDADLISPMAFYVRPNVANTGAISARIRNVDAEPDVFTPYYDVVRADGSDFPSGDFATDTDYLLVFLGGELRCLSQYEFGSDANIPKTYIYTASDTLDLTLIKAVKSADTPVDVLLWGGGQGGGRTSGLNVAVNGGRGGGYIKATFRLGDLPDTITITVGSGGAGRNTNGNGNSGGNTSFGSLLIAAGGTETGAANSFNKSIPVFDADIEAGLRSTVVNDTLKAGAAGGGSVNGSGTGNNPTTAGTSNFGGNGGAPSTGTATAGTAPGGGGGSSLGGNAAAGARGECRVMIH